MAKKITLSSFDLGRLMSFVDVNKRANSSEMSAVEKLANWQRDDGTASGLIKTFPYLSKHIPLHELKI